MDPTKNEITQPEFNTICQDTVKRVNKNALIDLKKLQLNLDLIGQNGIKDKIDEEVTTKANLEMKKELDIKIGQSNTSRPPTMLELQDSSPFDKSTPIDTDRSVLKQKAIDETKQERQLLNYQRYLDLWDEHENKVQQHFKIQDTSKKSASAKKGIKNALKLQPKVLRDAVTSINDVRDQIDEVTDQEKLDRKLKTISLAKSMVDPRTDIGEYKIRISEELD